MTLTWKQIFIDNHSIGLPYLFAYPIQKHIAKSKCTLESKEIDTKGSKCDQAKWV